MLLVYYYESASARRMRFPSPHACEARARRLLAFGATVITTHFRAMMVTGTVVMTIMKVNRFSTIMKVNRFNKSVSRRRISAKM